MEKTLVRTENIQIANGGPNLTGDLTIPEEAHGIVVFAHGSGSSRFSVRNRCVAESLQESGLATLLIDLLTPDEELQDQVSGHLRFDIAMLAGRLVDATQWLAGDSRVARLPVGYFGASTGAGAALVAATRCPRRVAAVVSRGGRPDLAGLALPKVKAATLLIVGGDDMPVIQLNQQALTKLGSVTKQLVLVPGATHLFAERGALEHVTQLAADWFEQHLFDGEQ
ncbi:MAG: putative phosphoribosyl transferase [Planctomycetaceae bacterium]|nr:putative phosphoribosyl transferase [Planctomycetaceae bacterium]